MGAGEGEAPSGHDRSSHDRARAGVTSSAPIARIWTAGILTRAWPPLAPDDYLRAGADWHWLRSVTRFHGPASRGPPPTGGSIVVTWSQAVRLLGGEAKEHQHVSHCGRGRRDLTPSCRRGQSAPRQEAETTPKARLSAAPAPGYRIPATIHRAPWTVRPRRPAKRPAHVSLQPHHRRGAEDGRR